MPVRIIDRREIANQFNLSRVDAALQPAKIGNVLSTVKAVVTGYAGTTYDITTAAIKAAAVITGINLATDEMLPPIGHLLTLRVTAAGTGTVVGTYILTDVNGTALTAGTSAAVGIAKISDDGKTLTFTVTNITAFVIEYIPRCAVDMSAQYTNGL